MAEGSAETSTSSGPGRVEKARSRIVIGRVTIGGPPQGRIELDATERRAGLDLALASPPSLKRRFAAQSGAADID
jgi:hypothetical protein